MFGKKNSAMIAVLLIALLLVACGQPAAPQGTGATDATQAANAVGADQTADPAGAAQTAGAAAAGQAGNAPAQLTMWTFKVSHVPGLERVAADFKATTNIDVKVQGFSEYEVFKTKVKAAVNTGDMPDVLMYWTGPGTQELAAAGALVELTDKMTPDWKNVFYPASIESSYISQAVVDAAAKDPNSELKDLKVGQIFSVPFLAGNACLIFANKTKLKEAGLDPNKAPATWEEWVDMIKATKQKDPQNGGLVTGLQNPATGYFWLYRPMAYTYLGAEKFYARNSDKDFKWNSPESVRTLELYDMLSDLWMPGVLATDIDPADLAFAQGKAAFDVGGTYTLSFLEQQGMKAEDILIFPVPVPQGAAIKEVVLQPLGLVDVAVTKDAENQDAALEWIKYLTSKEGATTFAKVAHDMPATNIGSDKEVVGEQLATMLALFKDTENVFRTYDFSENPAGQDVTTPVASGLAKLISKETTPKQLADTITQVYADAWAAVQK